MSTRIARTAGAGSVALLAITLLTGAAPIGLPATPPSRPRVVPLRVENDNFLDMHVYAVRDGIFHPVGVVQSFSKEEFQLQEGWTGPGGQFRLFADPIGGIGGFLTEPLLVGPDQTIAFHIKESLNLSFATIEPTMVP